MDKLIFALPTEEQFFEGDGHVKLICPRPRDTIEIFARFRKDEGVSIFIDHDRGTGNFVNLAALRFPKENPETVSGTLVPEYSTELGIGKVVFRSSPEERRILTLETEDHETWKMKFFPPRHARRAIEADCTVVGTTKR